MKGRILLAACVGCLVFGNGCAHVHPWERGDLADYTMNGDRDPLGVAQAEHVFFSVKPPAVAAAWVAAAAAATENTIHVWSYEGPGRHGICRCLFARRPGGSRAKPFHRFTPSEGTNGESVLHVAFGLPTNHLLYATSCPSKSRVTPPSPPSACPNPPSFTTNSADTEKKPSRTRLKRQVRCRGGSPVP